MALPLRVGRFPRSFRGPRQAQLSQEAAVELVSRARRMIRSVLTISDAAKQITSLRKCIASLALAARTLPSVPYSPACPRYQMAILYMAIGKCTERCDDMRGAARAYRTALHICPYLVEARLLLAASIRDEADSQDDLSDVERLLVDAIESQRVLEQQLLEQLVFDRTPELQRESKSATTSENALTMLLIQEGRSAEADVHLRRLGFRFQLSKEVLHYALASTQITDIEAAKRCSKYAAIVDSALPPSMHAHLLNVFGPTSSFWREHDYHSPQCGYFSYLHPLRSSPPELHGKTTLDSIIAHVHKLVCEQFPAAREAKYAEWWAHCRRHSKGHQLHFDSDNEGETRAGGAPRHPIVSTVLFLTLAGGPTLITNQYLASDRLADQGWLIHPRENRLAMFDGSVLHGVIPGRSFCPPANANSPDALQRAPDGSVRRTTFMIAFWKDIVSAQRRPDGRPGAAIPFPGSALAARACNSDVDFARDHQWPLMMQPENSNASELIQEWQQLPAQCSSTQAAECGAHSDLNRPRTGLPLPITRVWDAVGGESRGRADMLNSMPSYNTCFQGF